MSILIKIIKDPLFSFLCLSACIFAIDALSQTPSKQRIHINEALRNTILYEEERLAGRTLSDEEKKAAIQQYIEDEILYREAKERNLQSDWVIRQRTINKMKLC